MARRQSWCCVFLCRSGVQRSVDYRDPVSPWVGTFAGMAALGFCLDQQHPDLFRRLLLAVASWSTIAIVRGCKMSSGQSRCIRANGSIPASPDHEEGVGAPWARAALGAVRVFNRRVQRRISGIFSSNSTFTRQVRGGPTASSGFSR